MNSSHVVYEFEGFYLDPDERVLRRGNAAVPLTPKATEILLALVARHGHIVEKEDLMRQVWPDIAVEESNLSQNIYTLRRVLSDTDGKSRFIETVPRRGYRFVATVREILEQPVNGVVAESFSGRACAEEAIGYDHDIGERRAEGGGEAHVNSEDRNSGLSRFRLLSRLRGTRRIGLLLGSVAVAIAGSATAISLFRADDPRGLVRPMPVTSLPGREFSPALSPDGSHVAFLWDAGDTQAPFFQLYVQPIGADRPLKLTHGQGDAVQPTWSPDMRHLAFLRHTDPKNGLLHDVVVVPATGGAERTVGTVIGGQHGLSWSPDGRFLAVVDKPSEKEPDAIFLFSTEDGRKQRLTAPPADYNGDCFPRFSPDGKSLAFVRIRTLSHSEVYVVNLVDGTLTRVTSDQSINSGVDWTQDGRSIIFASGPSTFLQRLWKVAATGGHSQGLDVAEGFDPATSRRNRALMVYVRFQFDSNVWRIPGPLPTSSDTTPRRLIESTQLDLMPTFSPDGKRIAFISRRTGTTEIWTSDHDGTNAARVTFLERDDLEMDVAWSPDAQQLAFSVWGGSNHDLHVIPAKGGFPQRITSTPEDERTPRFSRDGRWIYFTSRKSGSDEIWKVSRTGGTLVRVTWHGGFDAHESSDGRSLYFTKGRHYDQPQGIWRTPPLGGGEEEQLVDHGIAHEWDVFDRGVCYVRAGGGVEASIECYDVASRSVQRVAALERGPRVPGFSVSPDGEWILFTRVDTNESDLMMVENLK